MATGFTSRRKEQRIPAMMRAVVAVTPDSLKPASLATLTSCWAVDTSRHSAARMKGSNLKISFAPAQAKACNRQYKRTSNHKGLF